PEMAHNWVMHNSQMFLVYSEDSESSSTLCSELSSEEFILGFGQFLYLFTHL
ncbi:9302_t:CDS:2, partial [Funneliformis geosporum]